MTDPIADMLARLLERRPRQNSLVDIPASKLNLEKFARILKRKAISTQLRR